MDAILEGLPLDYASVLFVIESKKRPLSITKIEAFLYGHETMLHHYEQENHKLVTPLLNFTQGSYARGATKQRQLSWFCS